MIRKLKDIRTNMNFILHHHSKEDIDIRMFSPYLIAMVIGVLSVYECKNEEERDFDRIYQDTKMFYELLNTFRKKDNVAKIKNKSIVDKFVLLVDNLPEFLKRIIANDEFYENRWSPDIRPLKTSMELMAEINRRNIFHFGTEEFNAISIETLDKKQFLSLLEKIKKSKFQELKNIKKMWNIEIDYIWLELLRKSILEGGYLLNDEEFLYEIIMNKKSWQNYKEYLEKYLFSMIWKDDNKEKMREIVFSIDTNLGRRFIRFLGEGNNISDDILMNITNGLSGKEKYITYYYDKMGWDLGEIYIKEIFKKDGFYSINSVLSKKQFSYSICQKDFDIEDSENFFYIYTCLLILSFSFVL